MRLLIIVFLSFVLTGCQIQDKGIDPAMNLRSSLLEAEECSFQNTVTADYGTEVYTFQMDVQWKNTNTMQFTITDPETVKGITGSFSEEAASLVFDSTVLAFPALSEGELTPVSAPWLFLKALRSGYISGYAEESDGTRIYIDDSFEDMPLNFEVLLNDSGIPVFVEYIWQERRILSADIREFTIR